MRQDRYTTKFFYRVCINLEPRHYEFLKEISDIRFNGDYNHTIHYLLSKYLNYLYEIRIPATKKTETANYQPRTKTYRRWSIYINPVLWSKLFEMRHFIGYSISALIRIMLDWEMQSQGYDIIPLIPLPVLNFENLFNNNEELLDERWLNNYLYKKQGTYQTRQIFCSFFDQFY
jgi:hypothetical protein